MFALASADRPISETHSMLYRKNVTQEKYFCKLEQEYVLRNQICNVGY